MYILYSYRTLHNLTNIIRIVLNNKQYNIKYADGVASCLWLSPPFIGIP